MNESTQTRLKELTELLERSDPAPRSQAAAESEGDEATVSSPASDDQTLAWIDILWREWRNCEDETYARHLFELVVDTLVGAKSAPVIVLLGWLYGTPAGYLLGLIAANFNQLEAWQLAGKLPLALALLGGLAGAFGSVWISRWLSWRVWLGLLTPNVFANKIGGLGQSNLSLMGGFVAGFITLAGALNFPMEVFWLGAPLGALLGLIPGERQRVVMGGITGGVGAVIGSLVAQGNWLGTGVGIALGAWLGVTWGSVLLGGVITWSGILLGLVAFGLSEWLAGWLGLGLGFGLGLLPNLLGRGLSFEDAYNYRAWYTWWQKQPPLTKVASALRLAQTNQSPKTRALWQEPLSRLQHPEEASSPPETLVTALQSQGWVDRFIARHALVRLGGEATGALRKMALAEPGTWQQPVVWLLTNIEQETTHWLAWRLAYLLCPQCLTRFGRCSVSLSWGIKFTYYGCRGCGQSREFLEGIYQVVAVLDAAWQEPQRQQAEVLRVNWLIRRTLFDFDRVEIIQATDEEVERFAVQAGNDTNPWRQQRYQQVQCLVGPSCHLSQNTLRILERMFGTVESHPTLGAITEE